MNVTVKRIVGECGDVARDRWRFYYERALDMDGNTEEAMSSADVGLIAEYDRGVLVPSKRVSAVRTACVIAEGVFMHATSDGEIDPKVMAKFVAEFAKVKMDLP